MFFSGKRIRYGKSVKSMQGWHYNWAVEALRVAKPGATLMAFGGTRTYHRLACAIEDAGWEIRDTIAWMYGSGFPKSTDISKQLDKKAGAKRKITGYKSTHINRQNTENWKKSAQEMKHGAFKTETSNISGGGLTPIAEPATPEAKLWNGWKSHGLKPAFEPIILAMKPNDGTFANNALKHGVAGLNIDGGRVGTDNNLNGGAYSNNRKTSTNKIYGEYQRIEDDFQQPQGRFPANVILDEEAGKMLDEQSGVLKSGDLLPGHKRGDGTGNSFMGGGGIIKGKYGGDKGGASRFFYCAKASKSERNMGKMFYWKDGKEITKELYDKLEKENENLAEEKKHKTAKGNIHPTVKSLSLMRYLCNLTKTPTGGIILDPFAGSGSTLIAAIQTGRDFIGIEKEEEYIKIAEARIKYWQDKEAEKLL